MCPKIVSLIFVCLGLFFPLQGVKAAQERRVWAIAWSPDGSRIAVAETGGVLQILDAETLQVLISSVHPKQDIRILAWNRTGTRLAGGGWDGRVRIWEPDTGQLLATTSDLADLVTGIEWTSNDQRLIISGFSVGYSIWDTSTNQLVTNFVGGGDYQIDLNPDDRRLALAAGRIGIVHYETNEDITSLDGQQGFVLSVAWSPDGTKLASGGSDGTVRIWDVQQRVQLFVMQTQGLVESVAWSPDGSLIASQADETDIWDTTRGELITTLDTTGGRISWNPDGTELAYFDETIKIATFPQSGNLK